MTSSRKQILDYLQAKNMASASELSRALKMTAANVRHHLRVLCEEGAVEVISQRPTHGRGRPTLIYTLTRQAHRHNLDGLASALLETLVKSLSIEAQSEKLQQVASYLASAKNQKTPAHLTQRLFQAIQRLNEMGYQAHWEAHREAPRLVLGHCPYASILPEHPELCQMDASLLENLLGVPAQQVKKLAQDSRGARYCLFLAGGSK